MSIIEKVALKDSSRCWRNLKTEISEIDELEYVLYEEQSSSVEDFDEVIVVRKTKDSTGVIRTNNTPVCCIYLS